MNSFRAVWGFDGEVEGDLPFQPGDVIVVTDVKHMSWWTGHVEGAPERSGLVPRNYLEPIVEESDRENATRERRGSSGVVPGADGSLFTIRSRARVRDLRVTSAERKLSRFPDGSLELHSWYKIEVDTGRLRVVEKVRALKRYREFCELEVQFRRMFPQFDFAPASGLRSGNLMTAPRTARTMERRRKAAQSFLRSALHDEGVAALTIAFLFPDHGAEMEGPVSLSQGSPTAAPPDSPGAAVVVPPTLPDRSEEGDTEAGISPATGFPPKLTREDPSGIIQPHSPPRSTLAPGLSSTKDSSGLAEQEQEQEQQVGTDEPGSTEKEHEEQEVQQEDGDGEERGDADAVQMKEEVEEDGVDPAGAPTYRPVTLPSLDAFDELLEQGYCVIPDNADNAPSAGKRMYSSVGDRVTVSYALLVWDGAETHARLIQRVRTASFCIAEPDTPAARVPRLPPADCPGLVPLPPGLQPALQLVPQGESARILLTPEAGLGEKGWPPIVPSNVHLVYDVAMRRVDRRRRRPATAADLCHSTTGPSQRSAAGVAASGNDDGNGDVEDDEPISLIQIRESIHARYAHAVGPQAGQRHSFAKQSVSREVPRPARGSAVSSAGIHGSRGGGGGGGGVNASQIARGEVSMEEVESMLRASVAADLEQRTRDGDAGGSGALLPNRMDTEETESDVDEVDRGESRGGRKSWWSISSSFSFSRGQRRSETVGSAPNASSTREQRRVGDRARSESAHQAPKGMRPMRRFRRWLGGRASDTDVKKPPVE